MIKVSALGWGVVSEVPLDTALTRSPGELGPAVGESLKVEIEVALGASYQVVGA